MKVWHIFKLRQEYNGEYLAIADYLFHHNVINQEEARFLDKVFLRDKVTDREPDTLEEELLSIYRILRHNSPDYNIHFRLAHGRMPISALLDLSWYTNNIYGSGHSVTPKQTDGTYHIYHNMCIGHVPEIQYNLDRKCFEPRDIHISTELLEQALEEYQFLNMFAEDPEKPELELEEEKEDFFTLPESPQPETPQPPIKEIPSEESIPQHRTLQPVKSVLKQ